MVDDATQSIVTHRVRVKLCGLTRERDLEVACEAGVDAIGVICYPPSPRFVTVEQFRRLADLAGPFVTVVAVVVNPKEAYLRELTEHVGFDVVQFHGSESPEFCRQWGKPWIKATRVQPGMDVKSALLAPYPDARGWLVDAYREGVMGGTGETFDWALLDGVDRDRLVLSGGLTVDNIESAVRQVQPFAVDVSSGVEQTPGVKDATKIHALMAAVAQASANRVD